MDITLPDIVSPKISTLNFPVVGLGYAFTSGVAGKAIPTHASTVTNCVMLLEQPPPVYTYTITCVPGPATEGLNVLPETPVPASCPPGGVSASVTGPCHAQ